MDCGHWIQSGFWSNVQQDLESSRDISKYQQYEKGNYKTTSAGLSSNTDIHNSIYAR